MKSIKRNLEVVHILYKSSKIRHQIRFTIVNRVMSSRGSRFRFPPSLSPSPSPGFRSPISATGLASSRRLSSSVLSSLLYLWIDETEDQKTLGPNEARKRTCSSLPSPIGSRPKSFTRSASSRASIPARRRVAYVSRCTPSMIFSTRTLRPTNRCVSTIATARTEGERTIPNKGSRSPTTWRC